MSKQIDAVERFFEAVTKRDADAAQRLTVPTFVEHDPLVAGGIAGLAASIRQLAATDHRTLVRTLEDGPYVVAQSDGIAAGSNTFFDVFRFEHDLIAEHWRFSAEAGPPNKSGHTQVDGPTTLKTSTGQSRISRSFATTTKPSTSEATTGTRSDTSSTVAWFAMSQA